MSLSGFFDPEMYPRAWFGPEEYQVAGFDEEFIDAVFVAAATGAAIYKGFFDPELLPRAWSVAVAAQNIAQFDEDFVYEESVFVPSPSAAAAPSWGYLVSSGRRIDPSAAPKFGVPGSFWFDPGLPGVQHPKRQRQAGGPRSLLFRRVLLSAGAAETNAGDLRLLRLQRIWLRRSR